jgi:2-polyprenyl-3-methyl-5-hydroxy-6-metoxy-1,4-benzoquinol methylase
MDSKQRNTTGQEAWLEDTYEAWAARFGRPAEAALKLKKDPAVRLYPILPYFGDVKGKKIANLMGSNGTKGIALALLGAQVTVIDISEGNRKYAQELAAGAGVDIDYIVSDVLQLPQAVLQPQYDIVFAEMGIVHYFTNLKPFFEVVCSLLKPGGRFVLRDFHPVATKLLSSRGSTAKVRKHKVDGDYFDTSLEEKEVSFAKYMPEGIVTETQKVYWRRWTLGEIVTAVANSGLAVKLLQEEPNLSSEVYDKGIPKTFIIAADKC